MKQYALGKEPQYDREEEKIQAEDIQLRGTALEKFDNFWFYHKWKVTAVVASILLIIIISRSIIISFIRLCGIYAISK